MSIKRDIACCSQRRTSCIYQVWTVSKAGNDRMICCWGDSEGELKFEHPVPINKLLIRDSKDKRVGALHAR